MRNTKLTPEQRRSLNQWESTGHTESFELGTHDVSDRLLIRIHTQFTGHPSQTHTVVIDELDHRCLNDITGLANSTSELLGRFFWQRVKPLLPALSAVTIWESDTARATCRG